MKFFFWNDYFGFLFLQNWFMFLILKKTCCNFPSQLILLHKQCSWFMVEDLEDQNKSKFQECVNHTTIACIRDLNKINLIWQYDFRLESIFLIVDVAAPKILLASKVANSDPKFIILLLSPGLGMSKSPINFAVYNW